MVGSGKPDRDGLVSRDGSRIRPRSSPAVTSDQIADSPATASKDRAISPVIAKIKEAKANIGSAFSPHRAFRPCSERSHSTDGWQDAYHPPASATCANQPS